MSLFTRAFNKLGGYDQLVARFPGGPQPPGPVWERQSVQFSRSMRYQWCVTVVVAQGGIWLQARPPAQGLQAPLFVPWSEIREARPVRLFWRPAVRLGCGAPEVGAVTVFRPIWDVAAPFWTAAGGGRR